MDQHETLETSRRVNIKFKTQDKFNRKLNAAEGVPVWRYVFLINIFWIFSWRVAVTSVSTTESTVAANAQDAFQLGSWDVRRYKKMFPF